MNSKQRLDAYIGGQTVDRRPNLTILGSVVTRYGGIGMDECCTDFRRMVDCARRAAHDLEIDYIQVASDLAREAEGYGSILRFSADKVPAVTRYALDDIGQADEIKPLRAREIPRLFDLVRAAKLALDDPDIYPMTLAVGPMTVACYLRGFREILSDLNARPDAVGALLDKLCFTTLDFIDELANVGARYMYVADPVASVVTPEQYEQIVLPRHRRIFARMESVGICGRLHMCGDTTRILPYSCGCGARIIDVDSPVDLGRAIDIADERCIIGGNISPRRDVHSCGARHTYDAIMACAAKAGGKRALFMPGCELPIDTKRENIVAIAQALKDIGA